MKYLFFISLLSFSGMALSAEWKVIAESTSCEDKILIKGKEGEKYVLAVSGGVEKKLFAKDSSSFHENSMKTTEFISRNEGDQYSFIQPSYVEGNPPKIDITHEGQVKRCRMELTR